jgi:hypothetical protein
VESVLEFMIDRARQGYSGQQLQPKYQGQNTNTNKNKPQTYIKIGTEIYYFICFQCSMFDVPWYTCMHGCFNYTLLYCFLIFYFQVHLDIINDIFHEISNKNKQKM